MLKAISSIPPQWTMQRLFQLLGANMQLTTDQQFTKLFGGTLWDPYFIVADWQSGAFNTACAGGMFTGANKTGSAIVPVGQSYSALTGATTQQNCTVQASAVTFSVTPYLSLTTGNAAALTCNIYIYGACFD